MSLNVNDVNRVDETIVARDSIMQWFGQIAQSHNLYLYIAHL